MEIPATIVLQRILEAEKDYKIIVNQGGSRCFSATQKVITRSGSKPISKININDYVLSHGRHEEFKRVKKTFKLKNTKPCLRIRLRNGEVIEATEDHKVWFQGGWHSLKYVIDCWNDRNMENNSKFQ